MPAPRAKKISFLHSRRVSDRLRSFLDRVWDEYERLQHKLDDLDVYKLYVGGRPHGVVERDRDERLDHDDKHVVLEFLKGLVDIQPEPQIQPYGQALSLMIAKRGSDLKNLVERARKSQRDWKLRDLGRSFFHFTKLSGDPAAQRVYLNVVRQHRATVIVQTVLDWLANYQQNHRDLFGFETIEIAHQVLRHKDVDLRGVALAVEPRQYALQVQHDLGLKKPPGSFGDFWEC